MSPIFKHQTLSATTSAAERAEEMEQTKRQPNKVRIEPGTHVRVGVIFLAVAMEAIQSRFSAALAHFQFVGFSNEWFLKSIGNWRRNDLRCFRLRNRIFVSHLVLLSSKGGSHVEGDDVIF